MDTTDVVDEDGAWHDMPLERSKQVENEFYRAASRSSVLWRRMDSTDDPGEGAENGILWRETSGITAKAGSSHDIDETDSRLSRLESVSLRICKTTLQRRSRLN